ncbi:SDR family oxidoreductase [Streptomyces sp. ODS28]|uniref:SDR family oxidoreductase n=1 Tax=Streptomyces sp. ODS28 TaxID=3136688 RepID=UPI0031EC8D34
MSYESEDVQGSARDAARDPVRDPLPENVRGKVVVITGAGSGIGEATALLLAGRGASVVLGGRRTERLEELAARVEKAGGRAAWARTDVRRREEVAALVHLARDRFGRVDVLVNNAGVGLISPLDDLRVEDWEEMVDVNFKGVLYGIAAALPLFREQGHGHFVNTVSTAGLRIVPDQSVYAATKNAVRTLCEGLRQEAGDGLRVTAVSPGITRTEFADAMDPRMRERVAAGMEIAMPPEAVARAIAFAIEQPSDVDVGDIVVRPTAQG